MRGTGVRLTAVCLAVVLCLAGCTVPRDMPTAESTAAGFIATVDEVPPFADVPFVEIAGNVPRFTEEQLVTRSYEWYAPLDTLGRCGEVMACVGQDIMPTEERGSIGQVKPSGWHTVKYDQVDGKYLYNRCHLIGYQLTGENDNVCNLITGTRYMNTEGMLPFENEIAAYVKDTGYHVLYRVTPIFDGNNLVARGVELEAQSVEDDGSGIRFHVYVYNNQPEITIDYATGDSYVTATGGTTATEAAREYVLNTNSMKIHLPSCRYAQDIKEENRAVVHLEREKLISYGYTPCAVCAA